ncbi:MAG: hypothetical protein BYD32DRAFT_207181 [Podila humilis]|nr:MAG: hypothetical protein BYD32DRAFT_207181 [Podila humilis]
MTKKKKKKLEPHLQMKCNRCIHLGNLSFSGYCFETLIIISKAMGPLLCPKKSQNVSQFFNPSSLPWFCIVHVECSFIALILKTSGFLFFFHLGWGIAKRLSRSSQSSVHQKKKKKACCMPSLFTL